MTTLQAVIAVQFAINVIVIVWCRVLSGRLDAARDRADLLHERHARLLKRQHAVEAVLFVDGKAAKFSAHLVDLGGAP